MKSLGVIETRGWVAAIQAVDAACKSCGSDLHWLSQNRAPGW